MYVRQITVRKRAAEGSDPSAMSRQRDQDGDETAVRGPPFIKVDDFIIESDLHDGGEFYKEKAEKELRETPEVVQQALKDIRVLIQDEPDLEVPDDDEFYQKFMRPCKWYPKSAYELMKRFYKYRVNYPKYCNNLLPSKEKKVLSSEILVPMPERTPQGCRILLVNAGKKWNPKQISIDEMFRGVMLALDAAMAEPKTQIAGVHAILNMDGFSLSQVTYFTPSFAAALTEWVQRCLPCRLKGIHIVNQPYIFNMVFAIFKPFLLEKTRKRIHFYGTDYKSLATQLTAKCLPTNLGGELVMPKVPFGNGICEYFCWFEKEFEASNRNGYRAAIAR